MTLKEVKNWKEKCQKAKKEQEELVKAKYKALDEEIYEQMNQVLIGIKNDKIKCSCVRIKRENLPHPESMCHYLLGLGFIENGTGTEFTLNFF